MSKKGVSCACDGYMYGMDEYGKGKKKMGQVDLCFRWCTPYFFLSCCIRIWQGLRRQGDLQWVGVEG